MGAETQILGREMENLIGEALGMSAEEAKKKIQPYTAFASLNMDRDARKRACVAILQKYGVELDEQDVYFAGTPQGLAENVRGHNPVLGRRK